MLALEAQQVDVQQGLFDMGMDSLMSVELKTRLEKCIGRSLPTTLTFNHPSVGALAEFLAREVMDVPRAVAPAASAPAPQASQAPGRAAGTTELDYEDLTEEELEMLLAEKLAQLH